MHQTEHSFDMNELYLKILKSPLCSKKSKVYLHALFINEIHL